MKSWKSIWVLAANNVRGRYRSLIIWGVALGALGALYVALFPVMSSFLNDYLKTAPQSMRGLLGGITGSITIQKWLELEFLDRLVPVALPIMVIIIGARTVAGNEERKTLDLLMSNPLRRSSVVGAALATMGVSLAMVLAIAWIITYLAVPFAGVHLGPGYLAEALAALWPFCMIWGALALLISSATRRSTFALSIPLVLIVATYVVDALYQTSDSLKNLKYVSLLYYLGHPIEGHFPWTAVLCFVAATCAFAALAILGFNRRDIYT
jgi:ABC-2 type transport system permease protein